MRCADVNGIREINTTFTNVCKGGWGMPGFLTNSVKYNIVLCCWIGSGHTCRVGMR